MTKYLRSIFCKNEDAVFKEEQTEGQALHVFKLNDENKIELNTDIFKILMQDDLKNKKVCVVSIAGALRQGKSFLLNFLIRYLRKRYNKARRKNVTHWLSAADGPILGFPWKPGSAPHTFGILMWSEVFIAELPSGEEIAVILLDTQGSFDNLTTITECAKIFALSVLMSSVQIYNLKENIKQSDLSHLELFSGYGQLLSDNNFENRAPFQKILFLIRDWPYEFEKGFGAKGGEELLKEALNSDSEQADELKTLKNSIRENFSDISCFLLPRPGKRVMSSQTFQGELEEIHPEFRKYVEILVPTILAPENLIPKTINDEVVTVEGLVSMIKSYESSFKDVEDSSLKTVFLANSEAHHTVAIQETEKMFNTLMANCKYQEEADEIMSRVLENFRKKRKMGNNSVKKKYEDLLTQNLKEIYIQNYKSVIEKNEANRNWSSYVATGSATGAVTGGVSATLMAVGGVASGAVASEILAVTAFVGVVATATGFALGAAAVGLIGAARWIGDAWKHKKTDNINSNTNNTVNEENFSNHAEAVVYATDYDERRGNAEEDDEKKEPTNTVMYSCKQNSEVQRLHNRHFDLFGVTNIIAIVVVIVAMAIISSAVVVVIDKFSKA